MHVTNKLAMDSDPLVLPPAHERVACSEEANDAWCSPERELHGQDEASERGGARVVRCAVQARKVRQV